MANGRSSGRIVWGDEVHEFTDAPSYAEKNWGGAFPEKWFWVQCTSFGGGDELSVPAVGARRKLPGLGASEDVGLIGLHLRGEFIALTPADSTLEWEVAPWGEWRLEGRNARGINTIRTARYTHTAMYSALDRLVCLRTFSSRMITFWDLSQPNGR